MPYGIKFINNRNVTVIDENTVSASYNPTEYNLLREGPTVGNSANYYPTNALATLGLIAVKILPDTEEFGSNPTYDVDARSGGHVAAYTLAKSSGSSPTWPCKIIQPMDAVSGSGAYGFRIWKANGEVAFDSNRPLAYPSVARRFTVGQFVTIPKNGYVVMCSWYLHYTGQWVVGGNFRKTDSTSTTITFRAEHHAVGTTAPGIGAYVGNLLVFDELD